MNGFVTIYNVDGTVFTTIDLDKIQYTNSSTAIIALAFVALGIIGVSSKIAKKSL